MTEFLKHSHHTVGRREYSDILELTSNTVRLIIEGSIKHTSSPAVDSEMSEYSISEMCINQLRDVLDSITKS